MKDPSKSSIVLRVVLEGVLIIGPTHLKINSSETFLQLFNRVIKNPQSYDITKISARQNSSHDWHPIKEPSWDFLQHPYWRPVFTVWIHLMQTGRREICFDISRSLRCRSITPIKENHISNNVENVFSQNFVYLKNTMNKKESYIKTSSERVRGYGKGETK
ncbi:11881_t:CDS:1 [Acaulospora colombiana]|uniref:11881_t:CDS:1 n=1 Tax=Acaulospora colombiana TaxID=27376 RepID=A0ACA9MZG7_9GLOM|nr:11881_t:CDS:1 [Acaulospora colombiana]